MILIPIGCHVEMYTVFQYFVLCLKIDIFVEFLVSVFYLIQFVIKSGEMDWHSWVFLVVTVLMLPNLYLGRLAVRQKVGGCEAVADSPFYYT